ncbi:hypothetical protein [Longispora urticae]
MHTTPNLLVNPGAESGSSGWTSLQGAMAVTRYDAGGGYPTPTDPGPPDRGTAFFTGGTAAKSRSSQDVTLPDTAEIDAGRARYTLSGWLGGWSSQADDASLTAEFLSASNQVLATAAIGPVTPADRGDATGLWARTATGAVPAGSRTARLTLVFTRSGGSSNDGYADGLSLTLTIGGPTVSNLIVNGSGEASAGGTGTPSPQIPGWTTVEGAAAVVRYGASGYPTTSDPGPSDRGTNFLTGGNSVRTRLAQLITLPGTADIDAGRSRFTFGGWLGGYATQNDGVRLSVEFLPADGPPLGVVVLGPVTAAERSSRSGLLQRTAQGTVPPGSRTARVLLLFTRDGSGTANDGYADALHLTIGAA